jgi:hypothetical protein
MKSGASAFDLFQDVGGLCGPDEGLGFFVVKVDVVEDGRDEFLNAEEDAAAQSVFGIRQSNALCCAAALPSAVLCRVETT